VKVRKFLLKNGKKDKKKKKLLYFPAISSQIFGFSDTGRQICRCKNTYGYERRHQVSAPLRQTFDREKH